MTQVKILGLAAVAAMALMACIGASSASATVLCKTNSTPCPAGWRYPAGTTIRSSQEAGTADILKTTGGAIEDTCTSSSVEGSTANEGGSSETVHEEVAANQLTFGGCSNTTAVLEGGEIEIHHIAGTMNGTVTAKKFRITFFLGRTCVYTASTGTDLGTITGGTMATIDINAVLHKAEGLLCPETLIWEGKDTVTSPEPLYISES